MNKTLFKSLTVATLLGTVSLGVAAQNSAKTAEPTPKAAETAAAIAAAPITLLYIALSRQFIQGMTAGAVK